MKPRLRHTHSDIPNSLAAVRHIVVACILKAQKPHR